MEMSHGLQDSLTREWVFLIMERRAEAVVKRITAVPAILAIFALLAQFISSSSFQ
jgi:hypothetical protein